MTTNTDTPATTTSNILADLGDGLILRRATAADTRALAAFNGEIHSDVGPEEPDRFVATYTLDLLARPHPTLQPDLFTIVEDTGTGQIVSSLNLIPQTWSYGGIPFGVGRIELVGTRPAYRRRGLVRRQFEVVHRLSAERGDLVQGITGIPWYYRQFGYEMAITLGPSRALDQWRITDLDEGAAEPYRLRPATPADLPFIAELDARGRARDLVSCVRDLAAWRYELDGRSDENAERHVLAVIETADDTAQAAGFAAHRPWLWRAGLGVTAVELAPDVSWLGVVPSLLRALRELGARYAAADATMVPPPGATAFGQIAFMLGDDHPLYHALPDRLRPAGHPYAWYVRVPDLPAFIRRIAPVLERHLTGSVAAGYSGELKLSFFRDGLRLAFEEGRLTAAEPWSPPEDHAASDATFPPLTFLQLLFGYRSLAELRHAFPDCRAKEEAAALLAALFPPGPSNVWPIG